MLNIEPLRCGALTTLTGLADLLGLHGPVLMVGAGLSSIRIDTFPQSVAQLGASLSALTAVTDMIEREQRDLWQVNQRN